MKTYLLAAIEAGIVSKNETDLYSEDEFVFYPNVKNLYELGCADAKSWMDPNDYVKAIQNYEEMEDSGDAIFTDMRYDSAFTSYGFICHI